MIFLWPSSKLASPCIPCAMAFCQQAVIMTGIDILLQAFLERHGPYTCLVDGANVAMFGQNWEDGETGKKGGFRFDQIEDCHGPGLPWSGPI